MTTLVNPLQPLKADSPILVTESGITVFLQPNNNLFDTVSIIALQFSRESYTSLPSSTTILVKLVQPPKAHLPISVTEDGITTLVKLVQPSKAPSSISVTVSGISMLVNPVQPLKASCSILLTDDGITTLVNPLQQQKAASPIPVTENGISMLVISLHL